MKKVIGTISSVLFILIALQSCMAGVGNTLEGSGEFSGTAGFLLALCMLIAGIITATSKKSKGMTMTGIVFYVLGGIIGISNVGSYADLQVWSILSFIFAGFILFEFIKNKHTYETKKMKENLNEGGPY